MNKTGIAALIAAAGLCGAAYGSGDVFLFFTVTTTDGDNIIEAELGEDCALVTVSASMVDDPSFGLPLVAYGGSVLNLLGGDGTGTVTGWTIKNGLANIDPPGDTTFLVGESLMEVSTLQLSFGGFTTDNPIDLICFEWCTTQFSNRSVAYHSDLTPSLGVVGVLVLNAKGKIVSETWTGHDGDGKIYVTPAPAGLALLGLGGLVAGRRRR